jgi:hypothetical protein
MQIHFILGEEAIRIHDPQLDASRHIGLAQRIDAHVR